MVERELLSTPLHWSHIQLCTIKFPEIQKLTFFTKVYYIDLIILNSHKNNITGRGTILPMHSYLVGVSLLLMVNGTIVTALPNDDVRNNNAGNCIGVKSCRPRCVTLRLDRNEDCNAVGGIFELQSQLNPWDIKRFRTLNCQATQTCINNKCNQKLSGDLNISIGEQGYSGGYFYTNVQLPADEDTFTFCSIYPCPKDECALPEQMVSLAFFGIWI